MVNFTLVAATTLRVTVHLVKASMAAYIVVLLFIW